MTARAKRLDAHFALCASAAAGAAMLAGKNADAAIVYSGVVNIAIGGNFAGVYLNLVTGQTGNAAGAVAGYDFNPYYGGNALFMSTVVGNFVIGADGVHADALPPATVVGPASPWITSTNFPSMMNFQQPGQPGILGLKFRRESDSATLYGWARIIRSNAMNQPGTIVDYGYENTGQVILPGVVPMPSSLAMLALGAMTLRGRKRHRPAWFHRHTD